MVHCGGHIYELGKGEAFSTDKVGVDIMLDVQDTRVMLKWPTELRRRRSNESSGSDRWTEELSSPVRGRRASAGPSGRAGFASSPPPMMPQSPESPTPANNLSHNLITSASATFIADDSGLLTASGPVQIYEDGNSDSGRQSPEHRDSTPQPSPSRPALTRSVSNPDHKTPTSSFLSSHASDEFDSDPDEENDPIVHSFGPFGDNILPRLASTTFGSLTSPRSPHAARREPLRATSNSPHQSPKKHSPQKKTPRLGRRTSSESTRFNDSPIKNHVINQLAFSRIHSMPLTTIHKNLPAELKTLVRAASVSPGKTKLSLDNEETADLPKVGIDGRALSASDLRDMLEKVPCVGVIERSGKDAAGKPLENEFYYLPEMDANEMRREAVLGSRGGTGLRAVRKNHKVAFSVLGFRSIVILTSSSNTSGSAHVIDVAKEVQPLLLVVVVASLTAAFERFRKSTRKRIRKPTLYTGYADLPIERCRIKSKSCS